MTTLEIDLLSNLIQDAKKGFVSELSSEALFFLSHMGKNFLVNRKDVYLKKLIQTHIHFREILQNHSSYYLERKILLKLFKVQFENVYQSKTLGIAIAFNFFSEYERFHYRHFSQVLKRLVPGVRISADAFYSCRFPQEKILYCYIELEKIRGKHLTFNEYFKLKKALSHEILGSVEFSSSNLFIPKNEEEMYKNITKLNHELNSPLDLPHVMITFSGQRLDKLIFNIILVRILKPKDLSIKKLSKSFPAKVKFYVNKVKIVHEKYFKEANAFSIELKSFNFYRKNYLIDLLKARQYISVFLEESIGEFRDYNGGLLLKQSEQFELIKKEIQTETEDFPLYEELFFSLAPSSLQPLISPEVGAAFFQLFSKIKNSLLDSFYLLQYAYSHQALSIIIKTSSSILESAISNFSFDDSYIFVHTVKTIDQQIYYCILQLNPLDLSLLELLNEKLLQAKIESNVHSKDILRIPFSGNSQPTLHPHFTADNKETTLCKALFEGITRINLKGKVELAVAKKIEISSCKKQYTITLRSTKWSNGEEVTSHHFAKAWKSAISFRTKGIRARHFFLIKNAKKVFDGKVPLEDVGIHILAENQILIELEYPASYFLQILASPAYSPLYEIDHQEPNIFNGPFLLDSFKLNHQMNLLVNPFYWDRKNVKLKKIEIFLNKNVSSAISMYQKGELDWVGSPFCDLSKEIIENSKDLKFFKTYGIFWLFCNTKNPKLKSSKIRKALSYSIDREKIVRDILPYHRANYSILPEDLSLHAKETFLKNTYQAENLFKKGLEEMEMKRDQFSLSLDYSNISPERKKLAYYLKDSWESCFNIQVNVVERDWDTYWNNFYNGDFEIGGYCFFPIYENPIYFMELFQSEETNFAKWDDQKFQNSLELGKNTISKAKCINFLKKVECILEDEMPVIPIYNHRNLYFCKSNLKNLNPLKLVYLDFKWVYFDE